jgi:hypothetical protein
MLALSVLVASLGTFGYTLVTRVHKMSKHLGATIKISLAWVAQHLRFVHACPHIGLHKITSYFAASPYIKHYAQTHTTKNNFARSDF